MAPALPPSLPPSPTSPHPPHLTNSPFLFFFVSLLPFLLYCTSQEWCWYCGHSSTGGGFDWTRRCLPDPSSWSQFTVGCSSNVNRDANKRRLFFFFRLCWATQTSDKKWQTIPSASTALRQQHWHASNYLQVPPQKKIWCAVAQVLSVESCQGMASINQLRPAWNIKRQTSMCVMSCGLQTKATVVNCLSIRKDVSFHVKNWFPQK